MDPTKKMFTIPVTQYKRGFIQVAANNPKEAAARAQNEVDLAWNFEADVDDHPTISVNWSLLLEGLEALHEEACLGWIPENVTQEDIEWVRERMNDEKSRVE